MQLILDNPYRIIGLLVGATAAEQRRQLTRMQRYLEAEQAIDDGYSFSVLGGLNRTLDTLNEAASKLNLDSDKMSAALFWFYPDNKITDEPAFDALKAGNINLAEDIWTKLTSNGEVSQRNASAYSNLGTLYLSNIFKGTYTSEALFEQGVSLKLQFLESGFIKEFKALATDETYKTTKKELQLLFLNQLAAEIEKKQVITTNKLLDILTKQEFSAKEDFLKGFGQKPIEQIARKIEEAKTKRKENKANAFEIGTELYEQTDDIINELFSLLGKSNAKISSVSDKLSEEILQCGIDYFIHYKDSDTDPGNASMELFRKAKSLAIGNIAKQRCEENTENLQEWIVEKPERDKQKIIVEDLKFITSKLERFKKLSNSIENAKDLINSCKPKLLNIKKALGPRDNLYLQISSAIVSNAQSVIISVVNTAQEEFNNGGNISTRHLNNSHNPLALRVSLQLKFVSLEELTNTINFAYEVTGTMSSMDMIPIVKESFQKNWTTLGSIRVQLNNVNPQSSSNNSACYIATMAYGDYDHPQVIILRQFRDEVLDKSAFGKWFIKTYYRYSPKLVERLKKQKTVNSIIRKALNQFIKLIK